MEKQNNRWKAKPIVDTKKFPLKNKEKIVSEISKNIWKKSPQKTKNNVWRPTKMTDSILDKLRLCFSVGMTDEQACYFCQISTDVLYKYQRSNFEFIKEKGVLKESITMQARVNVWRSFDLLYKYLTYFYI